MMKELARKIREDVLILTSKNRAGHIGSMLSMADIVAALFSFANIDPKNINRDRLVLSKGHAGPVVAAALYEKGIIDKPAFDSYFCRGQGSPMFFNGLDYMSCSLGHGLSVAVGMALAAKIEGKKHKVYALVGNGECNEGAIWEGMITAAHFKLKNLVVIIDHNHMQAMGDSAKCMDMGSLESKFEAFGARVISVDGHNLSDIVAALKIEHECPLVIVAHTIKGKGVSFMENNPDYHYGYAKGKLLLKALCEVRMS